MSTVEDFKNAPVGATATRRATGRRATKVDRVEHCWVFPSGFYYDDKEMERWGYTLDPLYPLPTRGEIEKVLQREFGSFLAHNPANPARFWGQSADAVLALLKGKKE